MACTCVRVPVPVELHMSSRTPQERAQFRDLRAAYDAAFRQLSVQVQLWQSLARQATPDSVAVREAQTQTEKARTAYHKSRDVLADLMLAWPSGPRPLARSTGPGISGREAVPQGSGLAV